MSENPVIKKIILVMLVFAVLLFSFYVMDFKTARSETQANSVVSSYSSGNPELDFSGRIFLYIEGEDSLTMDLKEKLRNDLEAAGAEVISVSRIDENYDSQALLVNISKDNWLYTPVYASSDLNIVFFYTSTGKDTKYFEQFKEGNKSVVFINDNPMQGKKLMDGEIKMQDYTRGLVSLKAYKKHLAAEISEEIVKQLQAQFQQSL
ncbi:hypothetical protein RSJ42_14040 [Methanosarcina hadiensis]|uniref:hypothetical protein n=1 Tax=Methanosarcina hadiensis TaxID=3078083 RepID=UPI00397775DC